MSLSVDPINTFISPIGVAPRAASVSAPLNGEVFGFVMADMAADLNQNLEKAELASLNAMQGKASHYEVATSIMQAEQSLRAAIAVRDKITAAYLEITRMQI